MPTCAIVCMQLCRPYAIMRSASGEEPPGTQGPRRNRPSSQQRMHVHVRHFQAACMQQGGERCRLVHAVPNAAVHLMMKPHVHAAAPACGRARPNTKQAHHAPPPPSPRTLTYWHPRPRHPQSLTPNGTCRGVTMLQSTLMRASVSRTSVRAKTQAFPPGPALVVDGRTKPALGMPVRVCVMAECKVVTWDVSQGRRARDVANVADAVHHYWQLLMQGQRHLAAGHDKAQHIIVKHLCGL